jgi:hypothetical protein
MKFRKIQDFTPSHLKADFTIILKYPQRFIAMKRLLMDSHTTG